MDDIERRGHLILNVTLHVGAGTFKPVQSERVEDHVMHSEHIVVNAGVISLLAEAKAEGGKPVVAVGTTSVRTIESLYWLGVGVIAGNDVSHGLGQWDAYGLPQDIGVQEALAALAEHVKSSGLEELNTTTQIMIVPGYKFRVVDALITNFHQPHSTLLLLIGAFVGKDWRRIYEHALGSGYRFLSYGDSSLLMP